jgi:hypothetical protein
MAQTPCPSSSFLAVHLHGMVERCGEAPAKRR